MSTERVVERLNRALHALFAGDERMLLLGEDVLDPYGGAFGVTRGLSTAYPDRVITTPLSENGILGVANGLALCGNPVIVEVMFGDFLGLAFDQLVNFASNSATMYGRPVPMPLVVRCPVGGNRGYGPTHSQSPQKHFIGVPNLHLYELSPLHDVEALLRVAFSRQRPAILVEDKVLYTRPGFTDGRIDQAYGYSEFGGPSQWVHVRRHGDGSPDAVVIVPGGQAHAALAAVRDMTERVDLLVPGQLYPVAVDPVLPLLAEAGRVVVAEESTAGGTWGSEVASRLYEPLWAHLRAPVSLVSSAASVIPAAPHLEREVLLQPEHITAAVRRLLGRPVAARPSTVTLARAIHRGHELLVPSLNANDESCTLIEWLVKDGDPVTAGTPVASVETSKAVNDVEADRDGILQHARTPGEEVPFGAVLGYLDAAGAPTPARTQDRTQVAERGDRVQAAVAAAVSRSHQTIPAAFCAAQVRLGPAVALLTRVSEATGADVDLPSLIVKAIGVLRKEFPTCYGAVTEGGRVEPATSAHVAVTMDADAGLFLPVVTDADSRDLSDIADDLVEFRMLALDGQFPGERLAGAAISVSLNLIDGITLVQPLIMPPQVCMISVAGDPAGPSVTLGLAYDHRVVNGRAATQFLARLRAVLEQPDILA